MRKSLILLMFFLFFDLCAQQNKEIDVYILISKCSNIKVNKIKSKKYYEESYNLFWPSVPNFKKINLKVNKDGNLEDSISIVGYNKKITLIYRGNKKSEIKIKKNYIKNIIRYDDFEFYETDLQQFFLQAKNLFLIFEDNKELDYYKVKKVSVM